MKFAAVKALAISNLLDLEKKEKISREDGFQGILNAIAGDVRSKHRKRLQRQQEMESMNDALRHLAERKKYFEEQINSYNDYIEAGMSTMQRGKGSVVSTSFTFVLSHRVIGRNDLSFLSPSNISILEISRNRAKIPSLVPTSTQPRTCTIRGSCYPSTNFRRASSTKFYLLCHQTLPEFLLWCSRQQC